LILDKTNDKRVVCGRPFFFESKKYSTFSA
jgi:hypothetical protein